jgi:elongation factor P
MYETSDLRKGLKILYEGKPYVVTDCQFVKPGKGRAFTRTKIKNLATGAVLEITFFSGDRIDKPDLEEQTMQFSYVDGESYVFMNTETYEQVFISAEALGEQALYLTDNLVCSVLFFDGKPIDITLPNFVVLQVAETEPGFKGDTSGGTTKKAKMQTGLEIDVPLFVNEGEFLRIDTRTGAYVERVKK